MRRPEFQHRPVYRAQRYTGQLAFILYEDSLDWYFRADNPRLRTETALIQRKRVADAMRRLRKARNYE